MTSSLDFILAHPFTFLSDLLFLFSPPLSLVLFDLFVNILVHNLAEPAYEADVAQLEYKLVAGEHGLVIKVKGFNHKLPVSNMRESGCIQKLVLVFKLIVWIADICYSCCSTWLWIISLISPPLLTYSACLLSSWRKPTLTSSSSLRSLESASLLRLSLLQLYFICPCSPTHN